MSGRESKYVEAALEELRSPTFEQTRQYLEVLEPELESGIPKVARVDLETSEEVAVVWFRIKDEQFFLVISVTKEEHPKTHWVYVESANRVYFTATSTMLSYQELGALTGLRPLEGWSKGDSRPRGNGLYTFSRMSFKPLGSEAYELEEALKLLLDELEKDKQGVERLVHKATAYVAVGRYIYVDGNAGIHLEQGIIHRLSSLGLALDIDTYIGGIPFRESDV